MFELDEESRQEVMDGFRDLYSDIEPHLVALPNDRSDHRLDAVFRAIHSIKGNAAVVQLTAIVSFTHAIEDIIVAIKEKRLSISEPLCECIQLSLDRLRDLHYRELLGYKFPKLKEKEIKERLIAIAKSDDTTIHKAITALQQFMADGYSSDAIPDKPKPRDASHKKLIKIPTLPSGSSRQLLDLAFFQELSFRIEINNANWVNRSIQLFDWTQKINRIAGEVVDYEQLSAATYMHDVGMSFVRNETLQKQGQLNEAEMKEVHRHVAWGYDILIRMPGWEEAALIVLNHHERVDGKGYPNQLTTEHIHPGAKIISIVDAFFSMVNTRADRQHRRSILRAISEINAASGSQFDTFWVSAFNDMIKEEVKHGAI